MLENNNILEALDWLDGKKSMDRIALPFLLELHKNMFGHVWSWAGEYRTTNKNIGIDKEQIVPSLYQLLDDLKFWIDGDIYRPKEIAARFHHRLVAIHPFPNGNGRFSRIAADGLLKHQFGLSPFDWAKGHSLNVDGAIREEYIAALKEADRGTYTPLFDYLGITDHSEI